MSEIIKLKSKFFSFSIMMLICFTLVSCGKSNDKKIDQQVAPPTDQSVKPIGTQQQRDIIFNESKELIVETQNFLKQVDFEPSDCFKTAVYSNRLSSLFKRVKVETDPSSLAKINQINSKLKEVGAPEIGQNANEIISSQDYCMLSSDVIAGDKNKKDLAIDELKLKFFILNPTPFG